MATGIASLSPRDALAAQIRNAWGWAGDWNQGGIDRSSELADLFLNKGITNLSQLAGGKLQTAQQRDLGGYWAQLGGDAPAEWVSQPGYMGYAPEDLHTDYNIPKSQYVYGNGQTLGYLGDYNLDNTFGTKSNEYLQPDNLLAWSARGDGNVSYYIQHDVNGNPYVVPVWGSSSDADAVRQAALTLATPFMPMVGGELSGVLAPTLGAAAPYVSGAIIGGGSAALGGGDPLKGALLGAAGVGLNKLVQSSGIFDGIGDTGGASGFDDVERFDPRGFMYTTPDGEFMGPLPEGEFMGPLPQGSSSPLDSGVFSPSTVTITGAPLPTSGIGSILPAVGAVTTPAPPPQNVTIQGQRDQSIGIPLSSFGAVSGPVYGPLPPAPSPQNVTIESKRDREPTGISLDAFGSVAGPVYGPLPPIPTTAPAPSPRPSGGTEDDQVVITAPRDPSPVVITAPRDPIPVVNPGFLPDGGSQEPVTPRGPTMAEQPPDYSTWDSQPDTSQKLLDLLKTNPTLALQLLSGLLGNVLGGDDGTGGIGPGTAIDQTQLTATRPGKFQRQYVAPPEGYRPGFDPEHRFFSGIGSVGSQPPAPASAARPPDANIASYVQQNLQNPSAIYSAMNQYGVTFNDIMRAGNYDINDLMDYITQMRFGPLTNAFANWLQQEYVA